MSARQQFWGAIPTDREWSIALWAPCRDAVTVRVDGVDHPMERSPDGTHRAIVAAEAGAPYGFVVDGEFRPDPAARRQQGDVHGPSLLTLPRRPDPWAGRAWEEAAILELHVGTFTEEGTFAAAAERLPAIAATGVTAIELMPVSQFAGERGWGYDGVLPFAPHPAYGSPDDLASLIRTAHDLGLMVLLDVVYNHFGPDGAYIHQLAPAFFAEDRHTPWGAAIDFTRPAVREFFLSNVRMWVEEFGVDGLRLDAVHAYDDPSTPDFLTELGRTVRGLGVHVIAEDDRNLPLWRDNGSVTANWNDDHHHAVHCLLTGESEGYYAPFSVDPMADLVTALAEGHVEQGQERPHRDPPRGAPSAHLPLTAFVVANQTHDQVGNRAFGDRLLSLADPEAVRIAHALLLTSPAVPMLFMGEEIGARTPFLFFADFHDELGEAVRKGRAAEFQDFSGFSSDLPDPLSPETLAASRPYVNPPEDADEWRELTGRLLTLRAERVVPLLKSGRTGVDVRRTGPRSLRAEWRFAAGTVLTQANLGAAPDTPWADAEPADLSIAGASDPFAFAIRITAA